MSVYDIENNAIRILSALLRNRGHQVTEIYFKDWVNNRLDWPSEQEVENVLRILRGNQVELFGISIRASAYYGVVSELTKRLRKTLDIPIMWGGMHATLKPEECLRYADYALIGESEVSIIELTDALAEDADTTQIDGIWSHGRDGSIIANEIPHLIEDLDLLPFRDFHSKQKYWVNNNQVLNMDPIVADPTFRIMTSRGCYFACAYCYNSKLRNETYAGKGRYYRTRSVENVYQEIEYAQQHFRNLTRIQFDDEVFNTQRRWLDSFCKSYPQRFGYPFEIFLEPKLVRRELMQELKQAGLEVVYMGVQNVARINEILYNRKVPDDVVMDAVNTIVDLGLDLRSQVIVDDPISTTEDKDALFHMLMKFPKPFELYLFSLTVFPETELANKLIAQGLITSDEVEGPATKTFKQMRVDLNYPRAPEDVYWISLLVLITKWFVPRGLIRWLYRRRILRRYPRPLAWFAQITNVLKFASLLFRMILKGQLTWTLIRRWANVRSLVTQ